MSFPDIFCSDVLQPQEAAPHRIRSLVQSTPELAALTFRQRFFPALPGDAQDWIQIMRSTAEPQYTYTWHRSYTCLHTSIVHLFRKKKSKGCFLARNQSSGPKSSLPSGSHCSWIYPMLSVPKSIGANANSSSAATFHYQANSNSEEEVGGIVLAGLLHSRIQAKESHLTFPAQKHTISEKPVQPENCGPFPKTFPHLDVDRARRKLFGSRLHACDSRKSKSYECSAFFAPLPTMRAGKGQLICSLCNTLKFSGFNCSSVLRFCPSLPVNLEPHHFHHKG